MHTVIPYPDIPVGFSIGPFTIHWYGLMYILGFFLAWYLGQRRAGRPAPDGSPGPGTGWTKDDVTDLVTYAAAGVIIGGRIGYLLFYGMEFALQDPLYVFKLWDGGMSFHGGLLGILGAVAIYAHRRNRRFFAVTDFLAPLGVLGLFFGRLGNFINGELWGAPTNVPWAMVFPTGGPEPRHPSMLYEAILEGLVLFAILWIYTRKLRPVGVPSGIFLLGYGVARFAVELVREPDAQIGYLAGDWLTMGQVLTIPMILGGIVLIAWGIRNPVEVPQASTDTDVSDDDA